MINLEKLTDKELYGICKNWGSAVLEARRKFAGLLPEVYRREKVANEAGKSWLKKRGFTCLYEFAAKLAGMSGNQVDEVIRTDKRLEDKPILRNALVNGDVSLNKLARVVSIATVENQQTILGKVEALSKVALDCFVKDYKRENGRTGVRNMDGRDKPQNGQTGLYGQNGNADIGLTVAVVKMGSGQDGRGRAETIPSQDGGESDQKGSREPG